MLDRFGSGVSGKDWDAAAVSDLPAKQPVRALFGSAPVLDNRKVSSSAPGKRSAEVLWLRPPALAKVRVKSYGTLFAFDILALCGGFLTANLIRFGDVLAGPGLQNLLAILPVFLVIAFSQAAYSVEVLEKPRLGIARVLKALALAAGALLLALFYAKTSEVMSRLVFGVGVFTSAAFLVAYRYSFGRLLGRKHDWRFQNEVVLVDGAPGAWSNAPHIIYAENAGLNPYQNDPAMAGRIGRLLAGYDRVILNCEPQRRTQWVRYLKGVGVDVEVLMPELDYLGALSLRHLDGGSAVLVAAGPLGLRDRICKRALDLALGLAMLLFFAPLMLFVSIAIKLTSAGPVLFKQSRIGHGNRPFEVLKFRTMRIDACDANGVQSARVGDDRLTPIGGFLRRTSMDELPQLLNVVRGDMSIVGPRPHATASTAEDDLFWNIDERYWQRGAVKPGITGLAQIRGFRGATSTRKDLTDRVHADLEYLADWSISKDLAIILRTLRVIVHPRAF